MRNKFCYKPPKCWQFCDSSLNRLRQKYSHDYFQTIFQFHPQFSSLALTLKSSVYFPLCCLLPCPSSHIHLIPEAYSSRSCFSTLLLSNFLMVVLTSWVIFSNLFLLVFFFFCGSRGAAGGILSSHDPAPTPPHGTHSHGQSLDLSSINNCDLSLIQFQVTIITVLSLPLWTRQWHPTPVLLPGKSCGWRSLVGIIAITICTQFVELEYS